MAAVLNLRPFPPFLPSVLWRLPENSPLADNLFFQLSPPPCQPSPDCTGTKMQQLGNLLIFQSHKVFQMKDLCILGRQLINQVYQTFVGKAIDYLLLRRKLGSKGSQVFRQFSGLYFFFCLRKKSIAVCRASTVKKRFRFFSLSGKEC